ncbi:MAG TPA: alpha/beta hydrolase [Rhodothermales bacterium]|nr:alpha/beta hydrolase [Rhodothermales bacterium]
MHSKLLLCLLLGIVLVTRTPAVAHAQERAEHIRYRPSARVRVIPGLVFARYGTRTLRLDLYLPAERAGLVPGVVAIRGGGWAVSDRAEFAHVAAALAERGVAAASVEYRTADAAPFPAAIQDVKAAVRWIRANAAAYGIDPETIGTLGGSSGALMALLAGVTSGDPTFEGSGGHPDVPSHVQAVVAMAAPTDPRRLDASGRRTVGRFLRAMPSTYPERWARAAPITHIDAGDPPVLLLHSQADEAVLPEQSIRFARRYREVGARADLVLLPDAPHAFWNYAPWFAQSMDRAAAFFLHVARSN